MTSTVMVNKFLVEYDRVMSLSAPSYSTSQILDFLNRGQYAVTDDLVATKNYEMLGSLFANYGYTSLSSTHPFIDNSFYVDLTTGTTRYWKYVESFSEFTRTQLPVISAATFVKNEDIDRLMLGMLQDGGFDKVIFRRPKAFLDGSKLVVYYDSFTTLSKIYVNYVALPKTLVASAPGTGETTTCELPESLHDNVVSKAVELAKIAVGRVEEVAANLKLGYDGS